MWKLGLVSLALASLGAPWVPITALNAQAPAARERPRSINQTLSSVESVRRAWTRSRATRGRIEGVVDVDPHVQDAVLGSCRDIVVQIVSGRDWSRVAAVQAFGNIRDGQCHYAALLRPTSKLRVRGFYGAPSGSHPGDFLHVRPQQDVEVASRASQTARVDLSLTYDFVR